MRKKAVINKFIETNTEDNAKNGNCESYPEANNKTDYDMSNKWFAERWHDAQSSSHSHTFYLLWENKIFWQKWPLFLKMTL